MTQRCERATVVLLGHAGHGKSTVVGRLLADTGSVPSCAAPDDESVHREASAIDCTHARLRHHGREIVVIDPPGPKDLLASMISGAAQADAALLVIDASAGVCGQSRRHAYLAQFLSIRTFVVAVTKMDLAAFDERRFTMLERSIAEEFERLGLPAPAAVPVAGRAGDNLVTRSSRMPWYDGPVLLDLLLAPAASAAVDGPLRLPIQDVYRFDRGRILVGRVESGVVRIGDELLFSPSGRTARVATIERWNSPPVAEVSAGDVIGFTLDTPAFVERGDVASHLQQAPALSTAFRLHLAWLGAKPLAVGDVLVMKTATAETTVAVQRIERVFDLESLQPIVRTPGLVERGEAAWIRCESRATMALDSHAAIRQTGRCVLMDAAGTVGAGLLEVEAEPSFRRDVHRAPARVSRVPHEVGADARALRYGHHGAVVWLTGLPASGKSTLAMQVEAHLFRKGYRVYVLDGDNLRRGVNGDLRFSPEDRRENIRRAGEVAALFADAGLVVLGAFISPSAADRAIARAAAPHCFHEVYVRASLAACEARDPRGLYRAARSGEIAEFTGVSAGYEVPCEPDLEIDTEQLSIDEAVELLAGYIEAVTRIDVGEPDLVPSTYPPSMVRTL